ncbi:MAG: hypothetical protein ACK4IK_11810 [Bacteroidia bacterium]
MLSKNVILLLILFFQTSQLNIEQFNTLNQLIKTYSKNKTDILNKDLAVVVVRQEMCVACVKKIYEFITQNKSDKILFLLNEDIINEDEKIITPKSSVIVPNAVIMRRDIGVSTIGIIELSKNTIINTTTIDISNLDKEINRLKSRYK